MVIDVIMPKLGLTMEEGILVRWLVRAGQPVKAGEVIFEVETDKSVQEVESPADGYLSEILVDEGASVPVAAPVARISSELSPALPAQKKQPGESLSSVVFGEPESLHPVGPTPFPRVEPEQGRRFVSWRAKKVAAGLGIDLGQLGPGSGPHGRVIERDVQAAARTAGGQAAEWVELTNVQRITAQRMAHSFSETPHFYLTVDVNAGPLMELRQQLLPQFEQAHGVRLTLSDMLVKIAALVLLNHPLANASWEDGRIRLNRSVNIGLATAGPRGLLVPVIQQAGRLSLGEIAEARHRLVAKAQQGRLEPDEMSGGSFTLTNLGMYGIDQFQAIINPPQSVILAVGRIKQRPVGENGQVVLKPVFFLSLSCDHRVLDGAAGAAFLGEVARLIEKPASIA